jgi:cell division protein FtsB
VRKVRRGVARAGAGGWRDEGRRRDDGERRTVAAARRGLRRQGERGLRRIKLPQIKIPKIRALSEVARLSAAFQQRYLQRQRVRSVLLIFAGMWVVWTFLLGPASIPRYLAVRRENAELANEVRLLREQQAELQAEVNALASGKGMRVVERVARDQHAMIREGEVLVKFYDEGRGAQGINAIADDPAERILGERSGAR